MNWTYLNEAAAALTELKKVLLDRPEVKQFFTSEDSQIHALDDIIKKILQFSEEAISDMKTYNWNKVKVSKACRNKIMGEFDADNVQTHEGLIKLFSEWKEKNIQLDSPTYRKALSDFLKEMSAIDFVNAVNGRDLTFEHFGCTSASDGKGSHSPPPQSQPTKGRGQRRQGEAHEEQIAQSERTAGSQVEGQRAGVATTAATKQEDEEDNF
jgi:hypothetical protein